VTGKIEACRRNFGQMRVQQQVLKWMKSGVRGMAQIRRLAAEFAEIEFYGILDDLAARRLDEIELRGAGKARRTVE
jgi:hypothetical protein